MCPRNYHQKAEKYIHLVIKIAQDDMHYVSSSLCMYARSLQSCPSLCDPTYYSPPGSSVHGILQVRTLEWVAMPPTRGSSQPRDQTFISHISCIGRRVLYHLHHLGSPNHLQEIPNQKKGYIIYQMCKGLLLTQDIFSHRTILIECQTLDGL